LLNQTFVHCLRFLAAGLKNKKPGPFSVPVWLDVRKNQLKIISLV